MPPIRHFLLIYDVEHRELRHRDFDDAEAAAAAYAQAEEENRRSGSGLEIVLVGAESLDVIRRTHPQYFEHGDPLAALISR